MPIRHAIFDFDGSCTLVQCISERYLTTFGELLAARDPETAREWPGALDLVRRRSPEWGWTLGGVPSAPAAADPYILAYEAARHLVETLDLEPLPSEWHHRAYEASQADFRPDLIPVLRGLAARGIEIAFISNSKTTQIASRLDTHLAAIPELREKIRILGDARKFAIEEPAGPIAASLRERFEQLPPAVAAVGLERPVYLRRGAYLEALARIWKDDASAIEDTIVCGDIWELDLGLPAALGARVNLITRALPFTTYAYELQAVRDADGRGGTSDALLPILERLST